MLHKTTSIQIFIAIYLALTSVFSQKVTETRIIKGFLPIFENNILSGFFMVAAEASQPKERSFYITKCDVNLGVIATFVEKRNPDDEVGSMAFNNKALCVVYSSKRENEFVVYDPAQLKVIKRHMPPQNSALFEHTGAEFSKLYAYENNGFFFNKYTIDDKIICHFIGLDNTLRKTWEFKSNLGFEGQNVIPYTEKVHSEKYFVNHITRKKNAISPNNRNPSLIINSTQNGQLILHNNYDKPEELLFVDYPKVYVDDTLDVACLVGDYLDLKSKSRGWMLSKMDLKNKTKTNQFVEYNGAEIQKFLDMEYQSRASKNHLGLLPYAVHKFNEGYVITGEIYEAKPKNLIEFGLEGPQEGYSQSIFFCELDKDFRIVSFKYYDVADHKVNPKSKDARYTTAFSGSILDSRYDKAHGRVELLYLQDVSEKEVEYLKLVYGTDRVISNSFKKSFKRQGAHEQLNIFEGVTKFTVFRMRNGLLEITQE
ncbi:MAG TPA: hypothetical protein VL947_01250 [Cytophagales bacterium]|nr:hypothetical protein [Cytophagales bacterium]